MTKHDPADFDDSAPLVEPDDPLSGDSLSGDETLQLNDASVSGKDSPEWQALLDRQMTFLWPKNINRDAKQTDWTNSPSASFRQWLEGDDKKGGFTKHLTKKKKGYFPSVMGAAAKAAGYTSRSANGMKTVEMMGLDIDSGDSYLKALDRAEELALAVIGYTSFSDGTTETRVGRDKTLKTLGIDRDPTSEEMRGLLSDKFRPHIIETLEVVGTDHDEKGVQIVLHHAPLEKFRLLFPLAEPLLIASLATTQRGAQALYMSKLRGLAQLIGVILDESCLDVSRVFYMPSHPPGADFALDVIRGRGLTIQELPEVGKNGPQNVFEEAGAGADNDLIADMPARQWAAKYGKRLEIARLLEAEAPDKVRDDKGGLLVVECPHDEWHGNAGDPEDTACHVRDADGDTGFTWACKHNSCADRDRLDMIKKAIADGWFPEEALTDDDYLVPLPDEDTDDEATDPTPGEDETRFEPEKDWLPKAFTIKGSLIWGMIKDDEEAPLCQRFDVIGRASNLAGDAGAGVIISFTNVNGAEVEATLQMADLVRDGGGGVIEKLADAGMHLLVTRKTREPLLNLFRQIHPRRHVPTVPRSGWVQDRGGKIAGFMCPTGEYIPVAPADAAPYRLDTGATVKDPYPMGTLEGWKNAANAACQSVGEAPPNFHWLLGLAGGFCGPLLALAELDGCGVNLSGDSSLGKTLALALGASVWATPRDKKGVLFGMSGTANSIELIAARTSESFGAFDEIGRMQNAETLGPTLFNLASGSGKSRMRGRDVSAGLAEEADFRVFAFFSNERSLRTTITSAGGDYKTGLSARFPDVDVTGVARVSADTIQTVESVKANFGHAGPAFVRWLIAEGWHERGAELRQRIGEAVKKLAGDASPAQARASKVFALMQVAGELACEADLLPDAEKVRAAVATAWDTFKNSDEGKATEGEASLLEGFKSWVVRNIGRALIDAEDEDARHYGEALGWTTDKLIVLDWKAVEDVGKLGLSGTRSGLVKALKQCGALVPSGKNNFHNKLPPEIGGEVKNLRIDRAKLGLLPRGRTAFDRVA
ncbi:hypothetical protein BMI86_08010 [Thioclava sp. DLFJ5-1]|uniref:DUF927 domain-containing protein n=1 Tax=Thioclava sp. DLFJ5-1 TaxID=1915314 RepID=UPI0009976612|nr:DUF927 domain-containing protein [Thioclava sp. DLFJ5-1]OOY20477.1 hypothetical protein BMI86_08010 [Thioclava sp. DLFJ5-1]